MKQYLPKNSLLISLFMCLLNFFPLSAIASSDHDHDEAKLLLEAGNILPLEAILEKARLIHPGRILEVELEKEHKQFVYEIEMLLPNGKVIEILFDAQTGQYISSEDED